MRLGGGGLHCYNHFLELTFLCVCGGGGGAHLYQTFTWMWSNVGPQHDMPNQISDFRLCTHSWAPLKRTSVMLSSVRVSREKGITRAIQGNTVVWRGGGGGDVGNRKGGVQDTHEHNIGTSLLYRCATIYHVTPLMGRMCMEKWV